MFFVFFYLKAMAVNIYIDTTVVTEVLFSSETMPGCEFNLR